MSYTPQTEAQRIADGLLAETSKFGTPSIQRGLLNGAIQELRRLDAVEAENHQLREQVEELKGWLKAKSGLGEAVSALRNKLHVQLAVQLAKAVAEEREACAKVCDDRYAELFEPEARELAAAIRARRTP